MKPFPWRPGMLTTDGERVVRIVVEAGEYTLVRYIAEDPPDEGRDLFGPDVQPDRTDPATLGALLGVVREVYGVAGCPRAAEIYVQPQTNDVGWVVFRRGRPTDTCGGLGGPPKWKPLAIGSTEFDALLAAYEAAP